MAAVIAPAGLALVQILGPKLIELIQKFIPDKAAQQQVTLQYAQMLEQGELAELDAQLKQNLAQIAVNQADAQSPTFFNSGARPAILWIGAAAMLCYYVPYYLLATYFWAVASHKCGCLAPRPDMGLADLMGLITPLLGISTLRSVDKYNGVATK